MRFGITPKSMRLISSALMEREEIDQASIFGSRGIGNYKNGSDVDIAIYGYSITDEIVNQVSIMLNDKEIEAHIDRIGEIIFDRWDSSSDN